MVEVATPFDPGAHIPTEHSEILPVCPCGCRSKLPGEFIVPPERYHMDHYMLYGRTQIRAEEWIIRNEEWVDEPYVHYLRHLRMLMPWICHDPNLVRLYKTNFEAKAKGRKVLSMMGNASSGKTNFIVCRSFQTVVLWPQNSEVYVANPTKTAGKYLLWKEFQKQLGKQRFGKSHLKFIRKPGIISFTGAAEGPGTITLVSLYEDGTMRGNKMADPNKGELILAMDEVGEFPNDSILRIIANLKSQKGLQVLTGTNFRDIHGLDGSFHEPKNIEWSDLRIEHDYDWPTTVGGWSVRLDCMRSPNIVMGVDYYPYLLTEESHDLLLDYGPRSPDYLSQGRAFPSVESVGKTIISTNEIVASGAYEEIASFESKPERFAFLDPSFTFGGDAARITILDFGQEVIQKRGKETTPRIRVASADRLEVSESELWDDELLELAMKFRKGKPLKEGTEVGSTISVMDLCALRFGEYLLKHGIPFANAGYDDSMRGILVQAVNFYLGEKVTPYYYGGSADSKITFPIRKKWTKTPRGNVQIPMRNNELYGKMVSQQWFTAAAVIRAGYLRNGYLVEKAFGQMKRRIKLKIGEKKEDIESKSEYKKRNHNRSPDEADSLCGCINMIVERSLTPADDSSEFASTNSNRDAILAMNQKRTRRISPLSR